ncbi:hypothetical protein ACPCG0_05640 [Propionibacteriaceae bacterium Y1923]
MSEFSVQTSALHEAATQVTSSGGALKSAAGGMQEPDSIMLGIFMTPFLSAVLPGLAGLLKGTVNGAGHALEVFGERLSHTAQEYDQMEDEGARLSATIMKVD